MNVFDYYKKELEYIPCNICGSTDYRIIVKKTVNDLKANTVMCKKCGLIFINPRMKSQDYDDYYMSFYRHDRAAIKNKTYTDDVEKNFENARKFGKAIIAYMGQYVRKGLTVDVGSSTGGILYGMREARPDLELLGIEPSIDESAYAQSKGVKTIRGLFENINLDLKNKVANVLCVQSLNHLLDPKKFMLWAYEVLEPGGHIFLNVKNWRHQVRRMGKLSSGVQIDHVYMFTPESLKLLCEVTGFEVVYMGVDEGQPQSKIKKQKQDGLNTHHIRIVAKKSKIPTHINIQSKFIIWPYFVKIVYIFKYSHKLAFLRKMLHIG